MNSADLLARAFDNIRDLVTRTVEGISVEHLHARLDKEANTVAWLVWHLTRVQDDHVAEVAGSQQVWTADGWAKRFGLPFDDEAIGYGFSSEQVAAVRVESPDQLVGYHDAVHARSVAFVRGLADDGLDRVVDTSWDPPVTLGVRLLSVIGDDLQHVGQAAYARGLLERR